MTNTNRYQTLTLSDPEDTRRFYLGQRLWVTKGPWWRRALNYLTRVLVLSRPLYVVRIDRRRGALTLRREE